MGWFSTYVSDPPGNADQIAGIKDGLSAAAEKANSGQARDNYSESSQRAARRLYNFGAGLTSASSDVDKYYWKLRSIKSYVDGTLRPALQDLDKQFDATPMADRWSKFWELRKQALSIQDDYNSKYKELKQSAEELAQSLKGALAIEPVARNSKHVGTNDDPSRLSDSRRAIAHASTKSLKTSGQENTIHAKLDKDGSAIATT